MIGTWFLLGMLIIWARELWNICGGQKCPTCWWIATHDFQFERVYLQALDPSESDSRFAVVVFYGDTSPHKFLATLLSSLLTAYENKEATVVLRSTHAV